jgi:ABC-type transporter Mla maintaining outer membrane lipid asymmetry ATPase subunit MlaF
MTEPANILEFLNVVLPGAPHGQAEMRQLTFTLARGRILLVQLEAGNEYLPLADAAEGLVIPESGVIRWMGREWSKLEPQEELSARSRIGRVFEKNGWLSNLNVNENVTLCQRHHTRRPESDIVAEADSLARSFGLAEVPRRRPAFVSKRELKMAEWVRALIGNPLLLLLERPETGVPDDNLPKLIEAVQAALQRGAAAIWQTDRNAVWGASAWKEKICYRMQGAKMLLVEEK